MRLENSTLLGQYVVNRRLDHVEGWLNQGAAFATLLISRWQIQNGVVGHLGEIGVHHGKFFILLALLRQPNELAVAIDVFSDQARNIDKSGAGDYEKLISNIKNNVGDLAGIMIHQADSLDLPGRDLTNQNLPFSERGERNFRLFSVDGSHTARHTTNDIEVAFNILCAEGVVIVDDFYNAFWPGVQEGVQILLARRKDISIFAYGDNKAFLCWSKCHERYYDMFQPLREFSSIWKDVELHDRRCIFFSLADIRKFYSEQLERVQSIQGVFRDGEGGILRLREGWSPQRERDGTWMVSRTADFVISLPSSLVESCRNGGILTLEMAPFVHGLRASRRLIVSTNFGVSYEGRLTGQFSLDLQVPSEATGSPLELKIQSDEPESPSRFVQGSSDARSLAIKIKSFQFVVDG